MDYNGKEMETAYWYILYIKLVSVAQKAQTKPSIWVNSFAYNRIRAKLKLYGDSMLTKETTWYNENQLKL